MALSTDTVHPVYYVRDAKTGEVRASFVPTDGRRELAILGLRASYEAVFKSGTQETRVKVTRHSGHNYQATIGDDVVNFRAERIHQPLSEALPDVPYLLVPTQDLQTVSGYVDAA